ncbi:uncharacterized protein KY384_000159 [Bacidia gigantensis]|uniref:uncharacterized protein n=1 Tax=Bacidia gigantensis TaxID=2732470 RepID=UPI001D057DE8|nr:uncharacterized protein KY384_000159 [Bacidia gigantensis]KAG8526166.1 hypothetical protein KY384_000159 [Bacidia gigantensis]
MAIQFSEFKNDILVLALCISAFGFLSLLYLRHDFISSFGGIRALRFSGRCPENSHFADTVENGNEANLLHASTVENGNEARNRSAANVTKIEQVVETNKTNKTQDKENERFGSESNLEKGLSTHETQGNDHDNVTTKSIPFIQVSMAFRMPDEPGDGAPDRYKRPQQTHIDHGRRWGYSTHHFDRNVLSKTDLYEAYYSKSLFMESLMALEMAKPEESRMKWMVWYDADTIILNKEVPWSTFIPPSDTNLDHINVLITKDWVGLNNGVYMIRVCEWSLKLLIRSTSFPYLRPKDYSAANTGDQGIMKMLLNLPANRKHRLYQPRRWFQGYPPTFFGEGEVKMDGLINMHFPGLHGDQFAQHSTHYLDLLEKDPPSQEMPVEDTAYPSETASYWTHVSEATDILNKAKQYNKHLQGYHRTDIPEGTEFISSLKDLMDTLYERTDEDEQVLIAATKRMQRALALLRSVLPREQLKTDEQLEDEETEGLIVQQMELSKARKENLTEVLDSLESGQRELEDYWWLREEEE